MHLILKHPISKGNDVWHSSFTWSLALWVYGHYLRFSLNRAPHVRPVSLIQLSSPELGTAMAVLPFGTRRRLS